uniref:Uncharacterized protein n=1 Tax=Rangifer tarandus platyrhynchus TaxID=3082113 RepID=A0ACB0ETS8_RANTA|nr:unnamed protein product [Rangifer tarandus platyrhynchus]
MSAPGPEVPALHGCNQGPRVSASQELLGVNPAVLRDRLPPLGALLTKLTSFLLLGAQDQIKKLAHKECLVRPQKLTSGRQEESLQRSLHMRVEGSVSDVSFSSRRESVFTGTHKRTPETFQLCCSSRQEALDSRLFTVWTTHRPPNPYGSPFTFLPKETCGGVYSRRNSKPRDRNPECYQRDVSKAQTWLHPLCRVLQSPPPVPTDSCSAMLRLAQAGTWPLEENPERDRACGLFPPGIRGELHV